jgi:hypothetical protein
MGGYAFGNQQAETAGTYWRRRFIVLLTGLAAAGLVAWALSTALAVTPGARQPRSQAHDHKAGTGGHISPGQPGSASTAGQANGHGTILPAFCARRDIVLSLFTGQTQFGQRQWPAFNVSVVSTQQAECSFNVGSRHLALMIKEGPALIWSSADCAAGTAGLVAALRRGVPTVLAISWDRQTSAPGCPARASRVPAGVYTAYAVDGDLASTPVTFRLG